MSCFSHEDYLSQCIFDSNVRYFQHLVKEVWSVKKKHDVIRTWHSENVVIDAFAKVEDHIREWKKQFKNFGKFKAQLEEAVDEFDDFSMELDDELTSMEDTLVMCEDMCAACRGMQLKPPEQCSSMDGAKACKGEMLD